TSLPSFFSTTTVAQPFCNFRSHLAQVIEPLIVTSLSLSPASTVVPVNPMSSARPNSRAATVFMRYPPLKERRAAPQGAVPNSLLARFSSGGEYSHPAPRTQPCSSPTAAAHKTSAASPLTAAPGDLQSLFYPTRP